MEERKVWREEGLGRCMKCVHDTIVDAGAWADSAPALPCRDHHAVYLCYG